MPKYIDSSSPSFCRLESSFDIGGREMECSTKEGNFVYDPYEMDETLVTEFDLVCGSQYKARGDMIRFRKYHETSISLR